MECRGFFRRPVRGQQLVLVFVGEIAAIRYQVVRHKGHPGRVRQRFRLRLFILGEFFLALNLDAVFSLAFSDDGVISYYYVHFTGSEVEKTLHALGLSTNATVYASVPSDAVVDAFSEIFTASICSIRSGKLLNTSVEASMS